MSEKERRELAVRRYNAGESVATICSSLERSTVWLYKWLKRSRLGNENWAEGLPRTPCETPNRISTTMEKAVVETRKQLEATRYAQRGAYTISWRLKRQGIQPPSIRTINRIVERNDLVSKPTKYQPKGIDYPALKAENSNFLHGFDLLGPRYLKGSGRFYSHNSMDTFDRRCCINIRRRKTRIDVAYSLVNCWQILGLPQYLQMDNLVVTRGSNRYPHSFGLVVRLCLKLKVQPVFIPLSEPWRNGITERFQGVFDKSFYRPQVFKDFAHLCQEAKVFEDYHNKNHCYSTMNGKTPEEAVFGKLKHLPASFQLPQKLPVYPGRVHLVRFIRSDRVLDVFSERFPMPAEVEHEYVWSTIDTAEQKLSVYHDSKLVEEFDYPIPKTTYSPLEPES